MTGDRALTGIMWLCVAAVLAGIMVDNETLIAVVWPVAVGTFVVWAWLRVKHRVK